MRRIWIVLLAMAMTVALAAPSIEAQPPGPGGKKPMRAKSMRMPAGDDHKAMDSGKLADELGLEGKKKENFQKTFARHNEKKMAARDKLRQLMASLREALKKDASENKLASMLDEINAAIDRFDAIRKDEREDMRKLLTPMQNAKLLLKAREAGPGDRDRGPHGQDMQSGPPGSDMDRGDAKRRPMMPPQGR